MSDTVERPTATAVTEDSSFSPLPSPPLLQSSTSPHLPLPSPVGPTCTASTSPHPPLPSPVGPTCTASTSPHPPLPSPVEPTHTSSTSPHPSSASAKRQNLATKASDIRQKTDNFI